MRRLGHQPAEQEQARQRDQREHEHADQFAEDHPVQDRAEHRRLPEVRSQKSEVRGRRSEVGGQRSEVSLTSDL